MTSNTLKVLFLHGLDSSKESTKFETIDSKNKYCINVDYRNLNFQTVSEFYQEIINKIKPEILVGHSLGGYWALKMSALFQIPAIIANPSLKPNFREDYPAIHEYDLDHAIPQVAYIELGDEVLDMYAIEQQLSPYMTVHSVEGGHHRLANPQHLNHLIDYMQSTFLGQKDIKKAL